MRIFYWVNLNINKAKSGSYYMELDTFEPNKKEDSAPAEAEASASEVSEESELLQLTTVSDKVAPLLNDAGFTTIEKVSKATIDELTQIKGLGKIKAQKMIDEAQSQLKA